MIQAWRSFASSWRRATAPFTQTWRRVGSDGFTLVEMMIALLIIALVSAGLLATASLYARAIARVEAQASEVRHVAEAEQMVRRFVVAAAAGSSARWSCDDVTVAATCRLDDGVLGDCGLHAVRTSAGWALRADLGADQHQEISLPYRRVRLVCDTSLSKRGWSQSGDGTPRIIVMTTSGGAERPFLSVAAP